MVRFLYEVGEKILDRRHILGAGDDRQAFPSLRRLVRYLFDDRALTVHFQYLRARRCRLTNDSSWRTPILFGLVQPLKLPLATSLGSSRPLAADRGWSINGPPWTQLGRSHPDSHSVSRYAGCEVDTKHMFPALRCKPSSAASRWSAVSNDCACNGDYSGKPALRRSSKRTFARRSFLRAIVFLRNEIVSVGLRTCISSTSHSASSCRPALA